MLVAVPAGERVTRPLAQSASAEPAARKGLVSRAVTTVVHTVYEILEQIGIGRRP